MPMKINFIIGLNINIQQKINMRILNLSYDDYSNFAYDNCQALLSVGINALSLKRVKHPFGYENESRIASTKEIQSAIDRADIIQLFHTDSTWLDYAYNQGKRVVVYHTGTTYRQNPDHCNNIFNNKVERCFTDQCEFIGLGMKNETYIATAIDVEKIQPVISKKFPLPLFAHYPSNPSVKGTAKIREMLEHVFEGVSVGGDECFDINEDKLPHHYQLQRMNDCYVYIELFSPMQNNKPYGCFGVTAFEAAALGKIVITNNIHKKVYEDAYGECELIIANTEAEFISSVIDLMNGQGDELHYKMQKTRDWVVKNHSYEATGNRIKKILSL